MDAAVTRPNARVVGIEISFFPWLFSLLWARLRRQKNLTLRWGNFHHHALQDYDLILCYIHRAAMDALKDKLDAELRPHTYLLSNTFAVYGWKPIQIKKLDDLWKTRIMLYQIKPASEP